MTLNDWMNGSYLTKHHDIIVFFLANYSHHYKMDSRQLIFVA